MPGVNPFAVAERALPDGFLQGYLVLMVTLVAAGTLFDIFHTGSARYFFASWRRSRAKAARPVGGGELLSLAVQTAVVDVMTSGEFCSPRRRVAHLLTMYGFVVYAVTTAMMVFGERTPVAQASMVPTLWWIGALMVLAGGYWFWFFIRVDVAAEGQSPFRVMRADLFILSLLASVTLGLAWAAAGGAVGWLFGLYLLATTVLFGSVPWSKFAHMFFKPAVALEKRVSVANGTRGNLPAPANKPETLGAPVKHVRHY
jgi:hypothetical protein